MTAAESFITIGGLIGTVYRFDFWPLLVLVAVYKNGVLE